MDPNSLSSLDPKLRETYEKVMGSQPTATNDVASPPPADNTPPAQPVQNADAGVNPPAADTPSPELSSTPNQDATPPQDQEPQVVTISQSLPAPTADNQIVQPHGHSGLIKVFYVLGTTVFFVIYIFFWMKIFNISLPF
jgi:hypothetical protein